MPQQIKTLELTFVFLVLTSAVWLYNPKTVNAAEALKSCWLARTVYNANGQQYSTGNRGWSEKVFGDTVPESCLELCEIIFELEKKKWMKKNFSFEARCKDNGNFISDSWHSQETAFTHARHYADTLKSTPKPQAFPKSETSRPNKPVPVNFKTTPVDIYEQLTEQRWVECRELYSDAAGQKQCAKDKFREQMEGCQHHSGADKTNCLIEKYGY